MSTIYTSGKTPSTSDATLDTVAGDWKRRSARLAGLTALALGVALLILVANPQSTQASELNAPSTPAVSATVSAQVLVTTVGQRVVAIAKRYLGYRYTWGGIRPSTGFDCSGFSYYTYRLAGRPISRALSVQRWTGKAVAKVNLKAGDLVFFKNTFRAGLSHVGIYIGAGKFINAQSERVGVAIASLNSNYWRVHYLTARRP